MTPRDVRNSAPPRIFRSLGPDPAADADDPAERAGAEPLGEAGEGAGRHAAPVPPSAENQDPPIHG